MPRNPRMRTRAEILSALRHARNRMDAEESACANAPAKSPEWLKAIALYYEWSGRTRAYEYALRLESGEALPID